MKETVDFWQLLVGLCAVAGPVLAGWIGMSNRIRTLEVRQDNDDKNFNEFKADLKEVRKTTEDIYRELIREQEKNKSK